MDVVIFFVLIRYGYIVCYYLFVRKIKFVSFNYIVYFLVYVILVGFLLLIVYSRNRFSNIYVKC